MGDFVPSDYTPLIFQGETDERGVSGVAWEEQLVSVPLRTWTETNVALSHYKEQAEAWRVRWADENDRAEAYRCDLERLRKAE